MTLPDESEPPSDANRRWPVLSKVEIVGLVVAVAIAILLAVPALKHTYTGAILSGRPAVPPDVPLPATTYPPPYVPAR
jgi:hypothetical protein